jgi:hypothetical protein
MPSNTTDLKFYKEYPKTCEPDDFWGQVKRTVNGKPVTQDQIDMIVQVACNTLNLSKNDRLLDLCCGNGALTRYFFDACSGGLGVDFSEYLINIAKNNFIKRSDEKFLLQDVVEFAKTYEYPKLFSKAICYGSFMFLPHEAAYDLLYYIRRRFPRISKIFIGNLPDKSKMDHFFSKHAYTPGVENDPGSPIGIWHDEREFILMSKKTGWKTVITRMPPEFYGSHYRYDAILTPLKEYP